MIRNRWRFAALYLFTVLINVTINAAFHQNDPGEVIQFIASCWAFSILAAAITYAVLSFRNWQK